MREINLSIILNHLWQYEPLSRAKLAKMTGLNKTTVSSLVQELLTRGFVREAGVTSAASGRPATLLETNPRAGYIIGAEIGGDFISVLLVDFSAQVEWRSYVPIDQAEGIEAILQTVVEQMHAAQARAQAGSAPLLGAGVGIAGLVDRRTGWVIFSPNLKWHDVPLQDILGGQLSLPVFVDNDAAVSALGEYYFGAARGCDTFIYLTIGVGLGGGIFIEGQPYRGLAGSAGEFGHMVFVIEDGPLCNCGNRGCWETLVSQDAVLRNVREALAAGRQSLIVDLAHGDPGNVNLALVTEAAEAGDPLAIQALEETGRYLGLGVANLINAYNPEAVIVGGVLSMASKFVMPIAREVVSQRALAWPASIADLREAKHGQDACALGAASLVIHKVLTQPTAV